MMPLVPLEVLLAAPGPVVIVEMGENGTPAGATAAARLRAPVSRVWSIVEDVERYKGRIPMIDKVRRDGDRIHIHLKFKVALFGVGFDFIASVRSEPERWLELRWVSGEPRGILLRFELTPHADGTETILQGAGRFDVHSLGWLAKYFLKHHPEIEHGIFPGVALVLLDSMRRALG